MIPALAKIGRWWAALHGPQRPEPPFAVHCACGAEVHGLRRARHQVVRCGACQQEVFVLPASPLPALPGPGAEEAIETKERPTAGSRLTRRRLPAAAAILTLTIVIIFFAFVFEWLKSADPGNTATAHDAVQGLIASARQSLRTGDYSQALGDLGKACDMADRRPDAFPAAERREAAQLRRQVEMLIRLYPDPLSQKLDEWSKLTDEDLKGIVPNYRERPFLFDLLDVSRDLAGQYTYRNNLGRPLPGLRLEGLDLLRSLPLDREPRRLVFAAKVDAVSRPDGREWRITFAPDSGVFLTDADVARACRLTVDPDLQKVLDWQAAQVNGMR